jgi:hypothetical protein
MTGKTGALTQNILKLFARNGQASEADVYLEQLRWKALRLMPLMGWPGILAIGLLMMCIPFYFSSISPLQENLDALRAELNKTRDHSLNQPANEHALDTPGDQLVEFYKFFPEEKTSPKWLSLMVETANKRGLALNHGEYAVARDTMGQLRRIRITLPVEGTYPQIRQYLAELISVIPNISLENVQFERKDIVDTELQAKIKLVLYLRHAP